MKLRTITLLFVIILFTGTGCGKGNATAEPSLDTSIEPTTAPAKITSSTGTYLSINEIGLGDNGYIALTNFTNVAVDLSGLVLCQGYDCFDLPNVSIAPGATSRVAVGNGKGVENVIATRAKLGKLSPSDGEIALFASQNVEDPKEMLVYFQWGSDPHELTETAVAAGLWVNGGYGPSSKTAVRLYKIQESGLWLFDQP